MTVINFSNQSRFAEGAEAHLVWDRLAHVRHMFAAVCNLNVGRKSQLSCLLSVLLLAVPSVPGAAVMLLLLVGKDPSTRLSLLVPAAVELM